jgi:hypothetical protein
LVRRFTRDVSDPSLAESGETYLDWNLKNQAGVPISSGVYIIYVDGGSLGTKVIKWFGVMRPIDLDTF